MRVLQVLSAYRIYQERPDNVAPMDVDDDGRGGVGGRAGAGAGAAVTAERGGKLGLEEKEMGGMVIDDDGQYGCFASAADVAALFRDHGPRRSAKETKYQAVGYVWRGEGGV